MDSILETNFINSCVQYNEFLEQAEVCETTIVEWKKRVRKLVDTGTHRFSQANKTGILLYNHFKWLKEKSKLRELVEVAFGKLALSAMSVYPAAK